MHRADGSGAGNWEKAARCERGGVTLGAEKGGCGNVPSMRVRDERGSVTLEAALVVQIVFLGLCLLAYMAIALYERAQMQAAVGVAATVASSGQIGAGAQSTGAQSITQSTSAQSTGGLYRRFRFGIGAEALDAAAESAQERFDAVALPGFTRASASARNEWGLLGSSVTVRLGGETVLPDGRPMQAFGFARTQAWAASATASVPDAAEFIRNVDFAMDLERELEEEFPELRQAADAYRGALDKIRGFIRGLL